MKVIDHEPSGWFLFDKDGALFFNALCSHGPVGYSRTIELNAEEVAAYRDQGSDYLAKLAYDIHYSAPVAKGNDSPYKARGVSRSNDDEMTTAVKVWRQAQQP